MHVSGKPQGIDMLPLVNVWLTSLALRATDGTLESVDDKNGFAGLHLHKKLIVGQISIRT